MRGADVLRMALRSLFARKLRSGLTVLSILLGAFSIVLMTSLADSGLNTLMRDIEDLGGARLMFVAPKTPVRMKNKASLSRGYLTDEDRRVLRESVPYLVASSLWAEGEEQDVMRDDGKLMTADLVGTDGGFFSLFAMESARGRFYSDEDNRRQARHCVIGSGVADTLFDGNGIGQRLKVGNITCQVVGQVKEKARFGMNFGFDWKNFVAMPISYLAESNRSVLMGATWQVKTQSSDKNDIAKRVINALLMARHHGVDDFEIWDFASMIGRFTQAFLILKVVVALVAGIALIVGGVGVMNMMFVSVSERRREIGIRKAIGASPSAIRDQFLVEAALLGGLGGAIGAALGVLCTLAANAVIHSAEPAWSGTVSMPALVAAVLSSFLAGLVFGTVPSRRAAQLDPIVAMRA
jgi:putative ABC transport system permease protein